MLVDSLDVRTVQGIDLRTALVNSLIGDVVRYHEGRAVGGSRGSG